MLFRMCFLLGSWMFGTILFAQDFENYQPLQNTGDLPPIFTIPSSDKYYQDVEKLEGLSEDELNDQKEFLAETHFGVDGLIRSGLVLFGDPVGEYVNAVGSKILEANPDFEEEIQFYVLRSSAVNAFATNQGIVFVTMGLLAQLETEAQLAYILSHELIHIKEKHALNIFQQTKELNDEASKQKLAERMTYDDWLVRRNGYSKELEIEADEHGFELFEQTNYSYADLLGVFDVLEFSYLPFDEVVYDRSFLETEDLKFPERYYLKELQEIVFDTTTDDSRSTHPNINKRRAAVQELVAQKDNSGRSSFILEEDRFKKIQTTARFELVEYDLLTFDFARALYDIFLLERDFPNNIYLQKSKAKALYALAKMEMAHNYSTIFPYSEIEGESQQLYYLLESMGDSLLSITALRHVLDVRAQYPDDPYLGEMADELYFWVEEFYEKEDFLSRSALKAAREVKLVVVDTTAKAPPAEDVAKTGSKYDKIRATKAQNVINTAKIDTSKFYATAFLDEVESGTFHAAYDSATIRKEKLRIAFENRKYKKSYVEDENLGHNLQEVAVMATISFLFPPAGVAFLVSDKEREACLGMDSVMIISPTHLRYKSSSNRPLDRILNDSLHYKFVDRLKKNAGLAGVHVSILDRNVLQTNDTETFNDILSLNQWFSQQINTDGASIKGFNQADIDAIAEKYQNRYFLWISVVADRSRRKSLYFAVLYDIKTTRYEIIKLKKLKRLDTNAMLNSQLYDIFNQIKKHPNK